MIRTITAFRLEYGGWALAREVEEALRAAVIVVWAIAAFGATVALVNQAPSGLGPDGLRSTIAGER